MSGENVEIVRPIYDAFNRRDWDALFRDTDPEFAFTYHNVGTDAGVRRGRDEVVAFAEEYGGAFDKLTWEPEEFIDREDWVMAVVRVSSLPRGGAVDLVVENGHLWKLRDGVVLSLESFPRPESALQAAELSKEPTAQEKVEIVRRVYEVAEARGVDGLLELATDDVVWISDPSFPGGGRQEGKESVRRWLTALWIYDEISIEVERIIDLEDRGALAITRLRGASADAPPVDFPWCHLFAFRGGLISQAQSFLDPAAAREAAGVPE
jgi:ketosteroid isomerase-like protein